MATTLAERMSKFSGSPTSALIAKVAELKRQGKDIISLNVGEPDFGTPDYIKVAEAFLQNLLFFMFLQSSNPLSFAFGYHN